MEKGFRVLVTIFALVLVICACNNKSTNKDRRCPALVEKAEYYNAQVANGANEGPM